MIIVAGCKSLLCQTIVHAQAGVRAKLAVSGVDPSTIDGLDDSFENIINPFEGLETSHLQEKYFRDTLDLVVSYLWFPGLSL